MVGSIAKCYRLLLPLMPCYRHLKVAIKSLQTCGILGSDEDDGTIITIDVHVCTCIFMENN